MRLRLLGRLEIEGVRFTRPKPLLLLAYLALEGPKERRHLAELFWPEAKRPLGSLSVALSQLHRAHPELVRTEGRRLHTPLETDVEALAEAVARGDWEGAVRLYAGVFAEGLDLPLGSELEEWVYQMRERTAHWAARAHLELGYRALHEGALARVRHHAEAAYALARAWGALEPKATIELLRLGESPWLDAAIRELGSSEGIPCRIPRPAGRHFGRRRELSEIEALFSRHRHRWIALAGLPGVGKTRTAAEVAERFCRRGQFPDGVFWVDLEGAAGPDLPRRIAEVLPSGPPPRGTGWEDLAARIDRQAILLVLDRLEADPDTGARLAWLIERCPGLHLLTTGRACLGVRGETCLVLEGLALVPEEEGEPAPAIALFLERARRFRDPPTPGELRAVARLCRNWAGHPLAIELAATWGDLLPLEELARRFAPPRLPRASDGVDALGRLLEETFAALPPGARRVLAGLTVFAGGFDAGAVEAVLGAGAEALRPLIDRGLVRAHDGRLELHPLLRPLAEAQLADAEPLRRAHARYYLGRLHDQAEELSRGSLLARQLMRRERANLRLAWERATGWGWLARLAPLVEPLLRFFDRHGAFEEGCRWFEPAATRAETDALRAPFALAAAWLRIRLGDLERARAWIARASPGQEPTLRARWELDLGMLAYREGAFSKAAEHWRRAAAYAGAAGDPWARTSALQNLAIARFSLGEHEEARRHLMEVLDLQEELGLEAEIAKTQNNLGNLLRVMGRYREAERMLREGLARAKRLGLGQVEPFLRYNLGQLALDVGRTREALAHFETARAGAGRSRERVLEASCHISLGLALTRLERWTEAEHHLRRGLAIAWQVREAAELARGLLVWARLALAEGRPELACRLARTVAGMPELRAHHRHELAELHGALDPAACRDAPYRSYEDALRELGAVREVQPGG